MLTRITAQQIKRRTPEQISALAREVVMGRKLVTAEDHAIQSAFYMILGMCSITEAAAARIGAVIGDYTKTTPRLACNGYPIFTSVEFLHADDVDAYNAELRRMLRAIGADD